MVAVLEYWVLRWRRTWTSNLITTVVLPFLLLASMGLGLGSLVDDGDSGQYLRFVAPGLLAATAMQSAVSDTTFPVMTAVQWQRHFEAMIATRLRPVDLATGLLAFVALRLVVVCGVFLTVAAMFGSVTSWLGVLAVPAAVLTGLAFAAPVMAFTVTLRQDYPLGLLLRFVVIPMYLFAGTFFPLGSLPVPVQAIGWLTPLWHGVELCRSLTTGQVWLPAAAGHILYLLAWVGVGSWLAARMLTRRLIS